MKTKIKRHSRAVISVVLAISMLISCMMVGIIATDAAYDNSRAVGADTAYLLVSTDNNPESWGTEHNVSSDSQTFEITPSTLGLTKFSTGTNYYVGLSSSTSYTNMYSQGGSSQVGTVTGDMFSGYSANSYNIDGTTFNFAHFSLNDDNVSSVTVTTSFSGNTTTYNFSANSSGTTTWSVAGNNTSLFGSAWNTSANDMTQDGTSSTYTWTKENVALEAGTIEYKIVKNHGWATAYPASNKTKKVDTAGNYNVTVTFNSSTQAMDMTLETAVIPTSTLSVASVTGATVTAACSVGTATSSSSLANVPQGTTVTVSVTPETNKMCSGVTYTPSGGSAQNATKSGSTWTFTMPGANTEVNASIRNITLKKIYFNNSYTLYGSVHAYVYDLNGSARTYEYLGSRPGTTMNKLDNSNIWYIEVPEDVDYVEFISGESYTTGQMSIPWNSYTYPKYTAPYGHNDAPTEDNGGTWGDYIFGSNNKRTNEYTVSNGSTMSASNLFTGISATMYDYYVDNEVTGGWLTGITDTSDYDNTGYTYHDPYYSYLNTELKKYANTANEPKYGITYPLYFGNLNYKNNSTEEAKYYNWNGVANNSNYLTNNKNAATGLSGTTLAGSTIHHYKSDGTNQNGAPMAMFDEDFLSGENSQNKVLASILRTSTFPVRQESVKKLYVDASAFSSWTNKNFYLYLWDDSNHDTKVEGTVSNNVWTFNVPSTYTWTNLIFYNTDDGVNGGWDNQTNDLYMPSDGNIKYTFSSVSNKKIAGTWGKLDSTATTNNHTYYEYDSTGGKDNAFITNIDTTNKTANIDYYNAASGKTVKSQNNNIGFFPFDYNNIIGPTTVYPTDTLYLDTTSCNSNNEVYFAKFTNDGSTYTTPVKMTQVGESKTYSVENPGGYTYVKFTRNDKNNESSEWNSTENKTVPNGTNNEVILTLSGYSGSTMNGAWSAKSDLVGTVTNGYADPTNHYAHDQGFGMKLTIPFTLNANGLNEDGTPQVFDFSGDDDLWVFVDGKLVLDLGGAHGATTGSINFNTKTVTANNSQAVASGVDRNGSFADGFNTNANYVHTMTIYYMERGMFDSNLKFGFSFHAIPNQFWIDKKIRTKDIINAGFYVDNQQSGTASNKNAAMTESEGRFISNFEKSYQDESFTVTHKHSGTTENPSASDATNLAAGVYYTIDNDTNTYQTDSTGTYPIKHDLGNAFIGQFTTGQYFNLKESYGAGNKYVYTPKFSVWDQANNNKAIEPGGNNTDGFTFKFSPTSTVQTTLENTNIKARFENYMTAHTLTLQKEIINVTDTETDFTFQIKFDFDYTGDSGFDQYIAYPLYCDVDGVRKQLSNTGTITVKAGQLIEIEEIPENAKVQVTEVPNDTYGYNSTTVTGEKSNTAANIANGKQFTMGSGDVNVVVKNTLGALTITHQLHANTDALGTCYVSAKVMDGDNEKYAYPETTGELEISPTYIKDDSTDDLEITLRTVPANDASEMDGFYEAITTLQALAEGTADQLGLNATVVINLNNFTATIKFPIDKLFNQTTKEQNVTTMPFYSKLSTWKWRMIFDVDSYRDLYRNMEYTTGSVPFTNSEWSQMTSTVMGPNQSDVNVPIKDFGKDDQRTAFINSHAPYENGFHNTYTWKTLPLRNNAPEDDTNMLIKVNETTKVITYIVKANQTAPGSVYATFQTPYQTNYENNMIPVKDGNQDVVQTDYVQNGGTLNWSTAYEGHYTIGGKYVTAPEKILISGTKEDNNRVYKYFSYWEVYTVATDKTSSQLYTKCYSPEFNLTLYQDSIMKAIYDNDTYKSPADNALADDTAVEGKVGSASITFMENSRTQWTADSATQRITQKNGSGGYSNLSENHSYRNGGDRIYTDFLISFTYLDTRLNNSTDTGLTPGLIVQTAGDLPTNGTTGLPETQTQKYYAENYTDSLSSSAVETFIKAGPGVKSSGDYLKSEFTLSELDNKNRINYYYSLPNISHSTLNPTVRMNKIYRAYSYLRDTSNNAVVISQPVYFTIYDIASIANSADGARYGGES